MRLTVQKSLLKNNPITKSKIDLSNLKNELSNSQITTEEFNGIKIEFDEINEQVIQKKADNIWKITNYNELLDTLKQIIMNY